jgi:hypothetical protein
MEIPDGGVAPRLSEGSEGRLEIMENVSVVVSNNQ